MSDQETIPISWRQVAAFRLSRHHLSERAPAGRFASVLGDMMGAQAQVLSAAQISIWARVKGATLGDVDSAIWGDRTLVRAWGMRRTMFLLPAKELALFARGTSRRPAYEYRWAVRRIGSHEELDRLLDCVLEGLKEPRTRADLAELLCKSNGYKLKFRAGGGWGSKRSVPWIEVGKTMLPVGYLLHVIGARDVICCGPNVGAESTYVRADKWIKGWRDIPVDVAERELLVRYLRAFGPSTLQDFALWFGIYVRDAKEIWTMQDEKIVQVDVEGWKAGVLMSDLSELEHAETDEPVVNLLPFFDSFLLGHKSHRNIVDEANHRKIYRAQGWVSPVLLVDGRAAGVWSHVQKNSKLEVKATPFSKLSSSVSSQLEMEASDLGRFLGTTDVTVVKA